MKANTYIVRQGDSPEAIAEAYTGNRSRAVELVYANPQVARDFVTLSDGRQVPTFRKDAFHYNMTLFLPDSFPRTPLRELAALPAMRTSCRPTPIDAFRDFVYIPGAGELPIHIAEKWTGVPGRWRELVGANANAGIEGSFVINAHGAECVFKTWPWTSILIPVSWGYTPRAALGGKIQKLAQPLVFAASVGLSAANDKCDIGGGITEVKAYLYEVQGGSGPGGAELPWQVAAHFNGDDKGLQRANYDDPAGFRDEGEGNCTWWGAWALGKLLKIPASWADPPQNSTLWKHIKKTGGAGDTGGGGITGPGTTGTGTTTTGDGGGSAAKKDYTWAYVLGAAIAAGTAGAVIVRHVVKKRQEEQATQPAV